MTSEAPERIWLQWVEPHCDDNTWCEDQINDDDAEYIRADLHQQALDAAREEGRKQGLEEAMRVAAKMDGEWFQNTYQSSYNKKRYTADAVERMLRKPLHILSEDIAEAIRALIDRPGDPVAEAARVLADHVRERHWKYYLIEMPLTKDGQGPATFGEDAVSVSYEVWEAETFRTVSSHVYLPDAIEAWLYTLAQKQGE